MIAIDTNVLIYAYDSRYPDRADAASDLIEQATDGVLLWQVACEFIAASRKLASQGLMIQVAWERLKELVNCYP